MLPQVLALIQHSMFQKAVVALVCDYQVVKNLDSQYVSGQPYPLRERDVIIARLKCARWMVVSYGDCRRSCLDCIREYLSGMGQRLVDNPSCYALGEENLVSSIESHDDEVLLLLVREVVGLPVDVVRAGD